MVRADRAHVVIVGGIHVGGCTGVLRIPSVLAPRLMRITCCGIAHTCPQLIAIHRHIPLIRTIFRVAAYHSTIAQLPFVLPTVPWEYLLHVLHNVLHVSDIPRLVTFFRIHVHVYVSRISLHATCVSLIVRLGVLCNGHRLGISTRADVNPLERQFEVSIGFRSVSRHARAFGRLVRVRFLRGLLPRGSSLVRVATDGVVVTWPEFGGGP